MYFADLQASLLEHLRVRVRNGLITERGLARLIGVSQPHMHNVLKGTRFLSSDLADQILQRLRISVFDLVERDRLTQYLRSEQSPASESALVPMLTGALGPGHPWPETVDTHQRFAVPVAQVANAQDAVVVLLAEDIRMRAIMQGGDFALLDQSLRVRSVIEPDGLYVVKRGNTGVVRRLRTCGRSIFVATDDCLSHPAAWERISLEIQYIQHVVRARATLLAKDTDWVY